MSLFDLFRLRPSKRYTELTQKIVTVETTAIQLLPINTKRIHYTIKNLSNTKVYLGPDENVATSGDDEGDLLTLNVQVMDDADQGSVWAIADASSRVHVIEVREVPKV